MTDDSELLRRYGEDENEEAFAELVQRHVNFVYSAALRQVNGDAHLASDVTQLVFTDFARKARSLMAHRVLAGWLFTSTRYAAAKLLRGEQRRRTREQEAQLMHDLHDEPGAQLDWRQVRPVLDEALAELKAGEREAILLRYFEGRDFAEVGARLSMNANAARMRVERALGKLHALLAQRGVTSTTAALATALGAQAVAAAPAGLALSVTGGALAGGSALAAGGSTSAAIFMGMTKLQVGFTVALALGGTAAFVMQAEANAAMRREVASLRAQSGDLAALKAEQRRLVQRAIEVEEARGDDAALDVLHEQSARLKEQLKTLAAKRAESERRHAAATLKEVASPDLAFLDRAPKPTAQARPIYPPELRQLGVSGSVVVQFIVDATGRVQNALAAESSQPEFERAAVEAVSRWKFEPGLKGGRAVNTSLQVSIAFSPAEEKMEGTGIAILEEAPR